MQRQTSHKSLQKRAAGGSSRPTDVWEARCVDVECAESEIE